MIIKEIVSFNEPSNTYIVENNDNALIIDCGAKVEEILKVTDCKVCAILLSHAHFDHIMHLKDYFTTFNCDIYVHENGIEKLYDSNLNLSSKFGSDKICFSKDDFKSNVIPLNFESTLNLIGLNIVLLELPGHSSCSVGYKINDHLFSGDTIFHNAYGRTDFYDGSNKDLRASLRKIFALTPITIHSGHKTSFNLPKQ